MIAGYRLQGALWVRNGGASSSAPRVSVAGNVARLFCSVSANNTFGHGSYAIDYTNTCSVLPNIHAFLEALSHFAEKGCIIYCMSFHYQRNDV
jgi:hypothetical protein